MPDTACDGAMQLLNQVFASGVIQNDGHEILARLEAGDQITDVVGDFGRKFGQADVADNILGLMEHWPSLHLEAVSEMVQWALGKLDTEDRVMIKWKGDAEHPETVTKFELRGHTLVIEFAHPPIGSGAGLR